MRNVFYKWFARFVILTPPIVGIALFLYGNYRMWSDTLSNDWVFAIVCILDCAAVIAALVGLILLLGRFGPQTWDWLWDHAELRHRRDSRL